MTNKILVVAAHPDDEVIGCGGALLRYIQQGDEIQIVYMTDGESSRRNQQHQQQLRNQAAINTNRYLNARPPICFDFPDNKMDVVPLLTIVQALEQAVKDFQPDIIYTHHFGDLNLDHRITHQAVLTCFRPQNKIQPKLICGFEINSSTEWSFNRQQAFVPNYFVDISAQLEEKQKLLDFYRQEMRSSPHTRSIEAITNQARLRGNHIGLAAAEAFEIIRQVQLFV